MRLILAYGDLFGEKLLGNLLNYSTFCESCGLTCMHCRNEYPSFSKDILYVAEMPKQLPPLIEDPKRYFPSEIPICDLVLAIGLHPDLLMYIPDLAQRARARAVIVPVEKRSWCATGLRMQIKDRLDSLGIESAFPKPFCSLDEEQGVIGRFVGKYMLGKPKMHIIIRNNMLEEIEVDRSAPCGSTWYVAQQIKWHRTEGLEEVIAKAHHTYPCTASMDVDPELGDTILHIGGYLIREAVFNAICEDWSTRFNREHEPIYVPTQEL